jgi:predicted O-methyltransferase YrrM
MFRKDQPWISYLLRLVAHLDINLTLFAQSDERRRLMKLFLRSARERRALLQPTEACQLMLALSAVSEIPGDMAEVGAFRGGSAKLLASVAPQRTLHLFDTFEGLPEPGEKDSRLFRRGQYRASEAELKDYLDGCNVRIYKGLFPGTAITLASQSFAFVHLDADLYQSTRDSLEFFYPRMQKGGIILAHDFAQRREGVYRAFQEFFRERPEPVIELTGNQAMIVKLA